MLVLRVDRPAARRARSAMHRLARRDRPRPRQDQRSCSWSSRRSTSSPPMPSRPDQARAPDRHPVHDRLRAARRDLGARADPRRDRPQGRRGSERNRARQRAWRSSACWSASPCSRSRSSSSSTISASTSPRWSPASASAASPSASPRKASSPTCSPRLSILFDKPFRRGDTIHYDQTTGTVERIGLKTTRLRSLNGEQVIMANTKLLEREIHNFAAGRSRRWSLPFGAGLPDRAGRARQGRRRWPRAAVEARKGCNLFAAPFSASARRASTSSCCMISRSVDVNKVAADRTAVALAVLRSFASTRSSSLTRPRPRSPRRRTER